MSTRQQLNKQVPMVTELCNQLSAKGKELAEKQQVLTRRQNLKKALSDIDTIAPNIGKAAFDVKAERNQACADRLIKVCKNLMV
jgi:hypothetical protein